ncbi:MAG: replication initiation protein [Bacteroidales bacterium]|nr:replication initiation protein [Bacteroidales bacterium]
MTDIVKYNNEMNTYPVFKLSEVEQDIFMALLSKTTFNGKQTIRANLRDLQSMVEFSRTSIDDFEQKANSLILKICNPKFSLISDEKIVVFVCFDRLEYNRKTYDLEVHIQDDFYAMMKNYKLGFTRFELAEFVNLSGSYAKTLYRLLKQYRTSGSWIVTVEDFRQLLNVPKTYRQREIDTRVLNPCIKQLSRELDMFDTVRVPFRNLKCEKIKKKGRGVKGRGGTITHYAFTFDAEKRELIEQSQEVQQPQEVQDTAPDFSEFEKQPQTATENDFFNMSAGEFASYYCTAMKDTKTDKTALIYALGARQDKDEIIKICNELTHAERNAKLNRELSEIR